MILSKTTRVRIHVNNFRYYESLFGRKLERNKYITVDVDKLLHVRGAIVTMQCDYCGNIVEDELYKHGDKFACSKECQTKKMRETYVKNNDFNSPFELKEVQEKSKQTLYKNYGVSNPGQSKIIQERSKETQRAHYNGKLYMQTDEARKRSSDICKSEEFKRQKIDTFMKKYGASSYLQSDEYLKKSYKRSYKYKQYVFPSGREIKVQGYEPYALDKLLKIYNENDIIAGTKDILNNIGKIPYLFEGKEKNYIPDIFIKSKNKIIEVKSLYTFNLRKDMNLCKQKACVDIGYNFEFMIL
ncbi:MAG TPA: hypothetical protein P5509_07440 [Bacteroidales bacterium]|nr:hypothetical protein [Bacteroidales bacterium]